MAPLASSSRPKSRLHDHDHHYHYREPQLHGGDGGGGRDWSTSVQLQLPSTSLSSSTSSLPRYRELKEIEPTYSQRLLSWMKHFVIMNFLPLGFLTALGLALTCPGPGRAVASIRITTSGGGDIRLVSFLNNCLVFFVSGLTLRMSHFKKLGAHWYSVLYGFVAILVLTPMLSLVVLRLPLEPVEFRQGLAIFAIVPSTLGVGVALTQAAHGNLAMALLLTVVSNLLGVVTVPYLLNTIIMGATAEQQQQQQQQGTISFISPSDLVGKLLLTVLIPTSLGVMLRASSAPLRHVITHHRVALSLFSSTNIFLIVWQSLSGARDLLLAQRGVDLVMVGLAALVLHSTCLACNFVVSHHVLRLDPPEAVAIIIMASMKSGIVAIAVISYVAPDLAAAGLLIIPCIAAQLVQIFLGSAISRRLASWVDREEEEEAGREEVQAAAAATALHHYQQTRGPADGSRKGKDEEEVKESEGLLVAAGSEGVVRYDAGCDKGDDHEDDDASGEGGGSSSSSEEDEEEAALASGV